jgi:cell division protein DivIC
MDELHTLEKKKKGQKRRKRILGVLMAIFCIWAGFTWRDQQATLTAKKDELTQVQQSADQVKLQNDELTYQVNRLNDKEYIAEIARRDYHLSKPGEVIFITPDK